MGEPSNSLSPTLFKRNAVVAIILVFALAVIRALPPAYMPPWQALALLLLCSLFWANLPLYKAGHRLRSLVLSVILVPLISIGAMPIAMPLGNFISAQQYRAEGLQLVNGCNGAAANSAYFEVQKLGEYVERLSDPKNTNLLAQLQSVRIVAEEKLKILNADCSRRGHRENHPWRTNWSEIKATLTNAEYAIFNQ
jgi:hypothetical protein